MKRLILHNNDCCYSPLNTLLFMENASKFFFKKKLQLCGLLLFLMSEELYLTNLSIAGHTFSNQERVNEKFESGTWLVRLP